MRQQTTLDEAWKPVTDAAQEILGVASAPQLGKIGACVLVASPCHCRMRRHWRRFQLSVVIVWCDIVQYQELRCN